MIDLAYIVESADFRMYEACPEILMPDRKPYKPPLRIKYTKPLVHDMSIPAVVKQAWQCGISYGMYMELKSRGKI